MNNYFFLLILLGSTLSQAAFSDGFEVWTGKCEELVGQLSAHGLNQWGNMRARDPNLSPLQALHGVHTLAESDPAIAKLEPLLGIGRTTPVDTQAYRDHLQDWVDEYAPGWKLVWPEELKALADARTEKDGYKGLDHVVIQPMNGYVSSRLHAELMMDKKLPIADPHDLLTHLPGLANPKYRSAMEKRARFLWKWMRSDFATPKFPVGPPVYDDDATVIAVGKLLVHLMGDVRDSTHENLPILVGQPGSRKLAWHGNITETLFPALSDPRTKNSKIADLLLGELEILPDHELPFFKEFQLAQPEVLNRFRQSQAALGKWGLEADKMSQQLDSIIEELRSSKLQRKGGAPAVEEFLDGLANRLGPPLDKAFDPNTRLAYLETSIELYDAYLKWLEQYKHTEAAANPPWVPRVLSRQIVSDPAGDHVVVEREYQGKRTKMEIPRQNRSLAELRKIWSGSIFSPSLRGKVIVDVNCGDGAAVRELKSSWGTKQVIGVDLALRDSQRGGKDRDLFLEGDGLKLPLRNNSVDVYHSLGGPLSYYAVDEEPANTALWDRALNEAWRVTRNRGTVAFNIPKGDRVQKIREIRSHGGFEIIQPTGVSWNSDEISPLFVLRVVK